MNFGKRRIINTLFYLVLISSLITLSILYSKSLNTTEPEGWIVYRAVLKSQLGSEEPLDYEYYFMNGDGNRTQWIWNYRGMPVWSPDGNYLAVSCEDDVYEICILNVDSIPDLRTWPRKEKLQRWTPTIYKRIDLPKECAGLVGDEDGLESISWSHDQKKIAIVCGDNFVNREGIQNTQRILCVVGIEDYYSGCWGELPIEVSQAVWSPTDNILAISRSTIYPEEFEIYLFDPALGTLDFLEKGIAPAWSPDGKNLAFLTELSEGEDLHRSGIAEVNRDGSGFRWIFENPEEAWKSFDVQCSFECKISWSPDGKFIAFQGEPKLGGLFEIFRLNIESGEVICLTCFDQTHAYNSLPDWGLPDFGW